jgi:hypothetical protein
MPKELVEYSEYGSQDWENLTSEGYVTAVVDLGVAVMVLIRS